MLIKNCCRCTQRLLIRVIDKGGISVSGGIPMVIEVMIMVVIVVAAIVAVLKKQTTREVEPVSLGVKTPAKSLQV